MSKFLYLIVFIIIINAQEHKPRKNMQVMMKWKLIEYLDLSEEQADKFFPKMNTYEKERKKINNQIKTIKEDVEAQINFNSSNRRKNQNSIDELKKLEIMKINKKAEYLSSLQKVLDPQQLSKLLVFDKKFKNTFGVIFDDICAGLYVVLILVAYMALK